MANTSPTKFRSIRAFKDYEARSYSLSVSDDEEKPRGLSDGGSREVSSLRVLDALKKSGKGLRRLDLAHELGADLAAIDKAVLHLMKDDFVTIRRGETPEDDLIVV